MRLSRNNDAVVLFFDILSDLAAKAKAFVVNSVIGRRALPLVESKFQDFDDRFG